MKNGSARGIRAACRGCMRAKWAQDHGLRRARIRRNGGTLSRVTTETIRRLMQRQGYLCACGCGESIRWEYHVDHRKPLARGGRHEESNWQLMTPACNLKKGAKDVAM